VRWPRHAHASHAIDNGVPITPVSATLDYANLKTTSVYAHAQTGESSTSRRANLLKQQYGRIFLLGQVSLGRLLA